MSVDCLPWFFLIPAIVVATLFLPLLLTFECVQWPRLEILGSLDPWLLVDWQELSGSAL